MPFHLEIHDPAGFRTLVVDRDELWIGGRKSQCEVELELEDSAGRVLEVRADGARIQVRVEPGVAFPVRSASGAVGSRFESFMSGDVLNVGPATVRITRTQAPERAEELDPAALRDTPGAQVGSWYQNFMDVADALEGIHAPERMVQTAIDAILQSTGAERVLVELDADHAISGQNAFFGSAGGDRRPFRISRSLVDQVRDGGRVVHVPVSSADPVASRFTSVRREGISSTIALPIKALGKTLGVLYADCVRDGRTLTAADLQRVAFIGRLLAGSLGNRVLVHSLVRHDSLGDHALPALQTASPAWAEVVERVKLYAPTDYTLLIRGETGTGKEVVARAVHELSRRRKGPFVPVNCAAIPAQLMESELFGHEKGSFTGASTNRRGHFEEADGGTLLLDEIGDMAHDLQAKILRVLQDRIVVPVGSRRQVRVDVRIVAATHQDLEQMVRQGRFREDLYYRLRELEIALPPLRERSEDVPLLAQRFLAEAAHELGYARVPDLEPDALLELQGREWRGNVRELRHVLKGAALRAGGGPLRAEHLDPGGPRARSTPAPEAPAAAAGATWKERLEAQERAALRETLSRANGNLTRGAELFGVPRTTYRERLVKHGLLKASDVPEGPVA